MICRDTSIGRALKARQRGYVINPFRFGGVVHDIPPDLVDVLLHFNSSSTGVDPVFSAANVYLCRFNAFNGSTRLVSDNGFVATIAGNAQISTAQFKDGGASYVSDGAGDAISYAAHSAFNFGTGDFTVELWVRPQTGGGGTAYGRLFQISPNSTTGGLYIVRLNNPNPLQLLIQGYRSGAYFNIFSTSTAMANDTWHHIALTRESGTYKLWINGAADGTSTPAAYTHSTGGEMRVGGSNTTGESFKGHFDQVRTTVGTARYTSAFTPPVAMAWSNTSTQDRSYTPKLTTLNGSNATISSAQSKFGGASLRITDASSGVFVDGLTPTIGTGDFCLEAWFRTDALGGIKLIISSSNGGLALSILATNRLRVSHTGVVDLLDGAIALSANTWHHVVACRASGTLRIFVDGVLDTSVANSTSISACEWFVGVRPAVGGSSNVYIEEVRIARYGRYTAAFTPPTAPFPNAD